MVSLLSRYLQNICKSRTLIVLLFSVWSGCSAYSVSDQAAQLIQCLIRLLSLFGVWSGCSAYSVADQAAQLIRWLIRYTNCMPKTLLRQSKIVIIAFNFCKVQKVFFITECSSKFLVQWYFFYDMSKACWMLLRFGSSTIPVFWTATYTSSTKEGNALRKTLLSSCCLKFGDRSSLWE